MASAALVPGPVVLALVVAFVAGVVPVLRPWGRTGPVSSHSSRAPSARTHAEGRLGGAVPRRRSRSSGKRAPRGDPDEGSRCRPSSKSPSRRVTSRAPRRATLPHCFARLGNGCSSSRVREEGRARGPSPDGVRVVVRCGGRRAVAPGPRRSGPGAADPGAAAGRGPARRGCAASACVAGPGLVPASRTRPGMPGAASGRRRLGSFRRCLTCAGPRCRSIGSTVVPWHRRPRRVLAPRSPVRRLRTRPHGPRSAPRIPARRRAGRAGAPAGRDDSAGGISAAPVDSTWPAPRPPRRRFPADRPCASWAARVPRAARPRPETTRSPRAEAPRGSRH